jgi:phenylacetate-CoA ligase
MFHSSFEERRRIEALDSESLARHQLARLNALMETVLPHNRFYGDKLSGVKLPLKSLDELANLPFTFKDELIGSAEVGGLAANLTYPAENYVRFHHTSGTRGRPLVVLDTAEDWKWWIDAWQFVLDAADVTAEDRALMAFSFGPFIGFWTAFDAVSQRGGLVIPSGGLSSVARLELMRTSVATALFCTPTYALHLAEKAAEIDFDVAESAIRVVIVAGEPGGSLPAVRQRIETAYRAKVIDHAGATEVGPWGFGDSSGRGLHINEDAFIAEFLSVETGRPAGEGELAELVLTTLGRSGCPVIRYRTGDLVKPTWNNDGPNRFVLLEGGLLGRTDDMMVIRGVNIFPSSIEQILRSFPEVVEFRIIAHKEGEMDALTIEVEDRRNDPARIAKELRLRLELRVRVNCVEIGSLPRFEGKGKRFVDQRANR